MLDQNPEPFEPLSAHCHNGPQVVGDNLWLWRADHALIDPNAGLACP